MQHDEQSGSLRIQFTGTALNVKLADILQGYLAKW